MIPELGQWVVWAATEAEAAESIVPNWLKLVITIAVFLIPYGLGVLIARLLKMKEYAFRISVVLFAATLGSMPFIYQGILGHYEQRHYEQRLAEYEARQKEFQISPEEVSTIQEQFPDLKIARPEEVTTPELEPAN